MTRYVLDTNIVSELTRPRPDPNVVAFLRAAPELLVSTILFHELEYGIAITKDPDRKARLLAFAEEMDALYGPATIAVDLEISRIAARLRARAKQQGRVLVFADAIMAASAIARDATLVTRNVRDFHDLDVSLLDPFASA